MFNLIAGKKSRIYIKVIALMAAFIFVFENIGYSFSDISQNKTHLRKPLALSTEQKEEFNPRYLALMLAAAHVSFEPLKFQKDFLLEQWSEAIAVWIAQSLRAYARAGYSDGALYLDQFVNILTATGVKDSFGEPAKGQIAPELREAFIKLALSTEDSGSIILKKLPDVLEYDSTSRTFRLSSKWKGKEENILDWRLAANESVKEPRQVIQGLKGEGRKNIGFFIARIGGTDGVSSEAMHWIRILAKLGHKVFVFAGELEDEEEFERVTGISHKRVIIVKAAALNNEVNKNIRKSAFMNSSNDETNSLNLASETLKQQIEQFISDNKIEIGVAENIFMLPSQVPFAIAMARIAREQKTGLRLISRDHDWYHERYPDGTLIRPEYDPATISKFGKSILQEIYGSLTAMEHIAISDYLVRLQTSLEASVIPNIVPEKDILKLPSPERILELRGALGIREKESMLLLPVRPVPRKNLKLAIEYAKALIEKGVKCKLVVGLRPEPGFETYVNELKDMARGNDVDLIFASEKLTGLHGFHPWELYSASDMVIYSSLHEGDGNNLKEAIAASRLALTYPYKAYKAHFRKYFKLLEFPERGSADEDSWRELIEETSRILKYMAENNGRYPDDVQKIVEANLANGRKYLSEEMVARELGAIIAKYNIQENKKRSLSRTVKGSKTTYGYFDPATSTITIDIEKARIAFKDIAPELSEDDQYKITGFVHCHEIFHQLVKKAGLSLDEIEEENLADIFAKKALNLKVTPKEGRKLAKLILPKKIKKQLNILYESPEFLLNLTQLGIDIYNTQSAEIGDKIPEGAKAKSVTDAHEDENRIIFELAGQIAEYDEIKSRIAGMVSQHLIGEDLWKEIKELIELYITVYPQAQDLSVWKNQNELTAKVNEEIVEIFLSLELTLSDKNREILKDAVKQIIDVKLGVGKPEESGFRKQGVLRLEELWSSYKTLCNSAEKGQLFIDVFIRLMYFSAVVEFKQGLGTTDLVEGRYTGEAIRRLQEEVNAKRKAQIDAFNAELLDGRKRFEIIKARLQPDIVSEIEAGLSSLSRNANVAEMDKVLSQLGQLEAVVKQLEEAGKKAKRLRSIVESTKHLGELVTADVAAIQPGEEDSLKERISSIEKDIDEFWVGLDNQKLNAIMARINVLSAEILGLQIRTCGIQVCQKIIDEIESLTTIYGSITELMEIEELAPFVFSDYESVQYVQRIEKFKQEIRELSSMIERARTVLPNIAASSAPQAPYQEFIDIFKNAPSLLKDLHKGAKVVSDKWFELAGPLKLLDKQGSVIGIVSSMEEFEQKTNGNTIEAIAAFFSQASQAVNQNQALGEDALIAAKNIVQSAVLSRDFSRVATTWESDNLVPAMPITPDVQWTHIASLLGQSRIAVRVIDEVANEMDALSLGSELKQGIFAKACNKAIKEGLAQGLNSLIQNIYGDEELKAKLACVLLIGELSSKTMVTKRGRWEQVTKPKAKTLKDFEEGMEVLFKSYPSLITMVNPEWIGHIHFMHGRILLEHKGQRPSLLKAERAIKAFNQALETAQSEDFKIICRAARSCTLLDLMRLRGQANLEQVNLAIEDLNFGIEHGCSEMPYQLALSHLLYYRVKLDERIKGEEEFNEYDARLAISLVQPAIENPNLLPPGEHLENFFRLRELAYLLYTYKGQDVEDLKQAVGFAEGMTVAHHQVNKTVPASEIEICADLQRELLVMMMIKEQDKAMQAGIGDGEEIQRIANALSNMCGLLINSPNPKKALWYVFRYYANAALGDDTAARNDLLEANRLSKDDKEREEIAALLEQYAVSQEPKHLLALKQPPEIKTDSDTKTAPDFFTPDREEMLIWAMLRDLQKEKGWQAARDKLKELQDQKKFATRIAEKIAAGKGISVEAMVLALKEAQKHLNKAPRAILDAGSGPSALHLTLLNQNLEFFLQARSDIIDQDISPEMLNEGLTQLDKRGIKKTGESQRSMPLNTLAVKPESMDLVYSGFSLHHLSSSDRTQALIMFHKALKQNGLCVIVVPTEVPDGSLKLIEYMGFDVMELANIGANCSLVILEKKRQIADIIDGTVELGEEVANVTKPEKLAVMARPQTVDSKPARPELRLKIFEGNTLEAKLKERSLAKDKEFRQILRSLGIGGLPKNITSLGFSKAELTTLAESYGQSLLKIADKVTNVLKSFQRAQGIIIPKDQKGQDKNPDMVFLRKLFLNMTALDIANIDDFSKQLQNEYEICLNLINRETARVRNEILYYHHIGLANVSYNEKDPELTNIVKQALSNERGRDFVDDEYNTEQAFKYSAYKLALSRILIRITAISSTRDRTEEHAAVLNKATLTQKPLTSESLTAEEIKAQIDGQGELKELSNEELSSLLDQLKPENQTHAPEFKAAFPNFNDELNAIISILKGETPSDRAPPKIKFYQLKEPLKDKGGLLINAIAYQEGDVLNIYITANNPIGLFHELYEHVISEENPNAHTLATVLESAFSDTIITQRVVNQLTSMTIEQLTAFIDKYESVKAEITQKFQKGPLRSYIFSFAEAVNIEAKRIKEIKVKAAAPLQGTSLSKDAVVILKETMESELSYDDREYLASLLEFMPTNLNNLDKYVVPTLLLSKDEKLMDVNTKFLDAGSGVGIVALYFALKFGVKSYGVELDVRQHQIAERLKRYLVDKGYISDEQVVLINDDIRNIDFRPFSIVYFHDPLTSTELEEAVYEKASDEMQIGSQLIQRIPPLIGITLEEQFDLAGTVRVAEEGKSTWANIYTKKSTLSAMQAIEAKPAGIAKDITKQPISDFSQVVGLLSEAIPDKELSDVQEISLGHIARYVADLLKKDELYYADLSKVSAIVKRFDMKIDYKDLDGVDLKKFKLWVTGLITQNPEIFAAVIEELLRHWDLGAYPILMEHIRQVYPDKYEKFLKHAEPELRRFLIRDYLKEKLSATNIDLSEIKKKKQQDFLKKVLGEISTDALPEDYFRIATYKIEHPEATPEEIAKEFSKSRTRINQMLFGYYRKDRKKYTSGILEIISDYIAEKYPDEYKSILKEMDSFLMRNLLPLVLEGGVKCEPIKVDEIAWLIKIVEELENSLSEEKKKLLLYKLQNPAKSQYDIADDLKISQNAVSGRLSGGPIRILTDKEDIEAMRLLFENDVAGRLYPEPLPVAAQHLPREGLRLGAFLYLGMSPSKVWALPADSIKVELLAVEKPKKAAKRIVKTTIIAPDVELDKVWANNWHWSMKINELLTELHKVKTKELPLGKEDIAWLKTALSVLYVKFHKMEFTLGLFEGAISKAEDCSDIKEAKKIISEFVDKLIGSFSNIPQDSDIRTFVVYELSPEAKKLEEDMQNGHFLEQAMNAIKEVNPAVAMPEEVAKLHPYISATEISLLAMVDNIPDVFFEKDSGFEIIEIQEDGVIFGSRKGEQFIQWKSEYKNGINELIDIQRKKYFSQHVDYQHGNDLSLAFDELRKAYEQESWGKILKERGNYLITSALNGEQAAFIERGYRSTWGTSEMVDIENNLFSHNIVSDQTTVMVLGLLEYFPKMLAEKDFPSRLGRLGWYWYPRKDGIVFVERLTGKEEFVPYAKDRTILPVLDRLSKIEKFSRQSFLNKLDENMLTLAIMPYDKARASVQRTNNRITLVYDNYGVVEAIASQRKQKHDEVQTERFNFIDLYLIEQALSLLPDSLDDVKDIYYPYQPLDDSFQSNRSFSIPDCYKHNANFLITHLGAGKAARLQAALLSKEIEKYLKDFDPEVLWVIASMRTILHEKAHRIWKNLSYLEQETYGKISWKWRKGKSEDATKNREKHFLFKYLTPEEDSFEEDFCDHFAAFILFGPQFAQESEKNEPIAVKLHFFQEKIFQGKPYAVSNNPDFKHIYQGLLSVTIAIAELSQAVLVTGTAESRQSL